MKKAFFVLVLLSVFAVSAYALGWTDPIFGKSAPAGSGSDSAAGGVGEVTALMDAKNFQAASDLLKSRISASASPGASELAQLALCQEKTGDRAGEAETCKRIVESWPEDKACSGALYRLGVMAREKGDRDIAAARFSEAVDRFPLSGHGALSAAELGSLSLEDRDPAAARKHYSKIMRTDIDEERAKAASILQKLADEMVRSQEPCADVAVHEVQPGDSLARIARKYNTAVGLVQAVNNLRGSVIHPGQLLKIFKGDVTLLVVKGRYRLSLFVGGVWFRDYEVGIGKNDSTPVGDFEISTKIENPPWHWQGRIIPPEDPENILGTRWMGFKNKPGLSGFGIHGTRDPSSVPGAVSRGCIRMRNSDVESLFELVPRGATVTIRD